MYVLTIYCSSRAASRDCTRLPSFHLPKPLEVLRLLSTVGQSRPGYERVLEAYGRRPQIHKIRRRQPRLLGAIPSVAYHWMPYICEVASDLVSAARRQGHTQRGHCPICLGVVHQHLFIVRDSLLPSDRHSYCARHFSQPPHYNGGVAFLHRVSLPDR